MTKKVPHLIVNKTEQCINKKIQNFVVIGVLKLFHNAHVFFTAIDNVQCLYKR